MAKNHGVLLASASIIASSSTADLSSCETNAATTRRLVLASRRPCSCRVPFIIDCAAFREATKVRVKLSGDVVTHLHPRPLSSFSRLIRHHLPQTQDGRP